MNIPFNSNTKIFLKNILVGITFTSIGGLSGLSIILIPKLEQAALLMILSVPCGIVFGLIVALGYIFQKQKIFNFYSITGVFLGITITTWLEVFYPFLFLFYFDFSYIVYSLFLSGFLFYLGNLLYKKKRKTK